MSLHWAPLYRLPYLETSVHWLGSVLVVGERSERKMPYLSDTGRETADKAKRSFAFHNKRFSTGERPGDWLEYSPLLTLLAVGLAYVRSLSNRWKMTWRG